MDDAATPKCYFLWTRPLCWVSSQSSPPSLGLADGFDVAPPETYLHKQYKAFAQPQKTCVSLRHYKGYKALEAASLQVASHTDYFLAVVYISAKMHFSHLVFPHPPETAQLYEQLQHALQQCERLEWLWMCLNMHMCTNLKFTWRDVSLANFPYCTHYNQSLHTCPIHNYLTVPFTRSSSRLPRLATSHFTAPPHPTNRGWPHFRGDRGFNQINKKVTWEPNIILTRLPLMFIQSFRPALQLWQEVTGRGGNSHAGFPKSIS